MKLEEVKNSIEQLLTCVNAGVSFFCAWCGKPIDTDLSQGQPKEGFMVSSDGQIYHIECYVHQVRPKKENQA